MGLQDVIRYLLPKEDRFYALLERQAVVAAQAAEVLATAGQGRSVHDVRDAVQQLEHDGDKLVHEVEEALALTFVTPIDREDIQSLSAQLDNILDLTNGTARAFVLLGVEQVPSEVQKLMELLVGCTARLQKALPLLRAHDWAKVVEESRAIRAQEKEADRIYRDAVSRLFHDPAVDAKQILRERELLEDMENAIDHCERVASTLIHLSVKHG